MARRGRVPPGAKAPFCHDCGSATCRPVGNEQTGWVWLCGSCETLRNNPDVTLRKVPPGLPRSWPKGRGKPQRDSLF